MNRTATFISLLVNFLLAVTFAFAALSRVAVIHGGHLGDSLLLGLLLTLSFFFVGLTYRQSQALWPTA